MKKLKIDQPIVNFEGEAIKTTAEENAPDFQLGHALLTYIRKGHSMGLTPADKTNAYHAGLKIGASKETELSNDEYKAIKKLTDNGKERQPNGAEEDIYRIEISEQVKQMVDGAEDIKQ